MSNNAVGAVAHYKLNDNVASTAVVDELGDYDGVYKDGGGAINTSTGASTGVVNGALAFDGDEYVDVGAGPGSVKSVSFWVNQADVAGVESLLDLNGADFVITSAGVVTVSGFATAILYIDGAVGTSGSSTITANWHHIVVTASAAKNASDFDIGRIGANYMEGLIDNVMLFDRVLSADEVLALYNAGSGTEQLGELDYAVVEGFTRTLRRR